MKILPPTTIFNRRKINESARVSREKASNQTNLKRLETVKDSTIYINSLYAYEFQR